MSKLPKSLTTVTPFSKLLAVILLVFVFPLTGFFIGMQYQRQLTSVSGNYLTPTPTPILNTGIQGKILIGPIKPVCKDTEPCTKPFQTTMIVKDASGNREIKRFTSDANGAFLINIPPGSYTLLPTTTTFPRYTGSARITIAPQEVKQMTLTFDSGLR